MRKMKSWKGILMMFATLTLASCRYDDDAFDTKNLCGTWEQVYDEGVVAEGYIRYMFTPETPTFGSCSIHCYDVFTGDTTYQRVYTLSNEDRRLVLFEPQYGGTSENQGWYILKLTKNQMTWSLVGHPDIIQNYQKVMVY